MQEMLVQEDDAPSEGRSCSIEHHNISSSSIEGMIRFGMPSMRAAQNNKASKNITKDKRSHKSPAKQ